jgi:hypothetical protein
LKLIQTIKRDIDKTHYSCWPTSSRPNTSWAASPNLEIGEDAPSAPGGGTGQIPVAAGDKVEWGWWLEVGGDSVYPFLGFGEEGAH